MPVSLRIEEISPASREAVLRISVAQEQLAYVSPIPEMLSGTDRHPAYTACAILVGDIVVGFFILVTERGVMRHYACSENPCGLEGFVIDSARQGRGYGRLAAAALRDFMAREFPDRSSLDLTVNCRNEAAIRTYLKAGFEDTGRLYHGGRSGPQHVFTMPLQND